MRLDDFLFKNQYFDSRTKANQSIKRGEVYLNGVQVIKPSFFVNENIDNNVMISSERSFVSLGGYKLDKALRDFNFNVNGLVCADIGSSTGGFTDCLLQNGAKKVYSVDLNDDLLHNSLKLNERVVRIIKNAKLLTKNDFNDKIDLIVGDLSFISLTAIINVLYDLIEQSKYVILLIKPQFELEVKKTVKNGIVRDKTDRLNACKKIYQCAISNGFSVVNFTNAPISKDKNVEYLILLKKSNEISLDFNILFNKYNLF